MAFILLIGRKFKDWMELTGGGIWVHLLLFQFWDACHHQIATFATDFQNANTYETERDPGELDISSLKDAARAFCVC